MPSPLEVYNAIDSFLAMRGYRPENSRGDPDGNQIRFWVAMIRKSGCGSGEESASSDECVRRLLGHMANVSDWDKSRHESALTAGGYKPDFVPWSKNSAGP